MVYLTRIERFNAAHKLWVDDWPEEKNVEVFGKCANKNWHGHNYKLHVTVKGVPDPITGFVMDAKELSMIVRKNIIDRVDHKNLNMDLDFLPEKMQPTTENMLILFWNLIAPKIEAAKLHSLKLIETETIYAEYYG